jgi:hypothetical protein
MKIPSLLAVLMSGVLSMACDPTGVDDGALVGSWLRTRDTGEMRDRWVFGDDGSFKFDENKPDDRQSEDHVTGTYTAADGIVTGTASNTAAPGQTRVTFSYYAGPTQFSSAALLPRGSHTGIVGVWTGIVRIEQVGDSSESPEGSEAEYEFRADGTFHGTATAFDGSAAKVADGTWTAAAGDEVVLTSTNSSGTSTTHTFRLLDGAALADDGRVWLRN